ncbi:MAG: TonB-dependent receptor plug domain-containing protein, partial [Magnetococcales bacterium]|nr:TonB-dependent receptor plug domain-containing protein [Magnetococcales bacterium]
MSGFKPHRLLGLLLLPLQAGTVFPAGPADAGEAGTTRLPEVTVSAPRESAVREEEPLVAKRTETNDTAQLLKTHPGVNLATGGGVSSLPIIHGLGDDRLAVTLDGMPITSACANHMNPPLSYVDPAQVGGINVMAGIAPVSAGGDNIGGAIAITSPAPVFAPAGSESQASGRIATHYRSNNNSLGGSFDATLAGRNTSFAYSGAADHAQDYTDGHGDRVRASLYETQNHSITLAGRGDEQEAVVKIGMQFMPYQGFPNQRMDLTENQGLFLNTGYKGSFGWGDLDTRVYWQDTRHEMNYIASEKSGNMPMKTHGVDLGYDVKGEIQLSAQHALKVGHDFHRFTLDDWWPPISATPNGGMSPDTFRNINNGQRDRFGLFGEWQAQWQPEWTTLLGLRGDVVRMDADPVQGYSRLNTAAVRYATDADAFNARDRDRTDNNIDLTATVRYEPSPNATYEGGYAR